MNTSSLRSRLLSLAIHGQLVPQDPNDEPASALLARIQAEKANAEKGKKRSPKPSTSVVNAPFEVPEGWCWTTLGKIGDVVTGSTPSKDVKEYYNGDIPFFKPTDLEQGIDTKYSNDHLSQLGYEVSRQIPANSVLVTCIGATIGKTGMITVDGTCNQQINAIIPSKAVSSVFLYMVCVSNFIQKQIKENASATTLPILNKNNFARILFPLPPLPEQHRITRVLTALFAQNDKIDEAKATLRTLVQRAKAKVLDLAIHGKLVPQLPEEENAAEVVKRICPDADVVTEGVPEGWCQTILGNLFSHNTGKALNASNKEGELKEYLTTSNVYWNSFDFSVVKKMLFKESELEKCTITKGDLLVCEGGDIGRAAIWNYDYDICIQNHIHRLRPKFDLCVPLYYYFLMYLKQNNMIAGKGIGMLGLSSNALHKISVPLPPLPEQHRIVAKIGEIFRELERIEGSL